MTTDPFIVRKAREIAGEAWLVWDMEQQAQCTCGHVRSAHIDNGCRNMSHQGMCQCSTFEQRQTDDDPYGPDGMGNLE